MAQLDGKHAIPPTNPVPPTDWKKLEGEGYVNINDRLALYPPVFAFDLSLAFPEKKIVKAGFEVVAPDGTVLLTETAKAEGSETLQRVPLDLRKLSPGRYRLEVKAKEKTGPVLAHTEPFYLDPDLPIQKVFGLIEIYHLAGNVLGMNYRLLDAGHRLQQPQYVVHFLNRYTYWRYLFRKTPDSTVVQNLQMGINDQQYRTHEPLPLTKSFIEIKTGGAEKKLLPNPSISSVKPEATDNRVYSDVFMYIEPITK